MKKIAVILIGLFVLYFGGISMAEELQKVEKLTDEEKAELLLAKDKANAARNALEQLKMDIANRHGIKAESYMEWETYVVFSGDYILLYYLSHMTGMPKLQ